MDLLPPSRASRHGTVGLIVKPDGSIPDGSIIDTHPGRHRQPRSGPVIWWRNVVNLIVLVIILMILFGGGGFYYGGPYVGGGLGTVLLIVLIVLLVRG